MTIATTRGGVARRRRGAYARRVLRASLTTLAVALAFLPGCYAFHDPGADVGPVDAVVTGPRSGPGTASCVPGRTVTVACGSRGLGACTGDPVLFVCDASRTPPDRCDDSSAGLLGFNDDDTGLCSGLTVTCPASGRLAVRARPFGGSGTLDCRWDTR